MGQTTRGTPATLALALDAEGGLLHGADLAHLFLLQRYRPTGLATLGTPATLALALDAEAGLLLGADLAHPRHSHLQHRQEFNRAEVEEEVEEEEEEEEKEEEEEEEEEEELINRCRLAKPAPLSPGWDISAP